MAWKRFPHYWAICEGNPLVPMDSPHKGPMFSLFYPEQAVDQTVSASDLRRYDVHATPRCETTTTIYLNEPERDF